MIRHPYFKDHVLQSGKLWISNRHKFLKTGKPLRNYGDAEEVAALEADLPIIAGKGYDNLSINCYWHHFNPSGDGTIEVSTEPLKRLLAAIHQHGMCTSLSVETYGVGGGHIPDGFFKRHPEAIAVNHEGEAVRDTEYGYDTAVPSLFSREYHDASRAYMKNLVRDLGAENFLYFETTVEPQYMGTQWLDFSEHAKLAYSKWLEANNIAGAAPFPSEFPADDSFIRSAIWNKFRAQSLAKWVNGDAEALTAGAGADKHLWIATDYLDAEHNTMMARCGDPLEFLRNLKHTNIIQLNWTWCNICRKPNSEAYKRIRQLLQETGRDLVITEHMTINGTDYHEREVEAILQNVVDNSSHFGWEFVDIAADRDNPETRPNEVLPGDFKPQHFAVYDSDWKPKPPMQVIEDNWESWMEKVTEKSAFQA